MLTGEDYARACCVICPYLSVRAPVVMTRQDLHYFGVTNELHQMRAVIITRVFLVGVPREYADGAGYITSSCILN